MLSRIYIKNIALIEECDIELGKNLNILSGETGAGKSIIIDSLNFVLGARADKGLIRYDKKKAQVTATFISVNNKAMSAMECMGLIPEDTIVLSRTMSEDGRSDNRINGKSVSISMLKEISAYLIDILSQHENHYLLKSSNHINLVDSYGALKISNIKNKLSNTYREYNALLSELKRYGDNEERFKKIDFLSYEIEEIKNASLSHGEEDDLLALRKKILNTEKIVIGINNSINNIDDYNNNSSALPLINYAIKELNNIIEYDDKLRIEAERLESIAIELKDIKDTINDILSDYDYNQGSLDKIENRLSTIKIIKKKYGGSIDSALTYYDKAQIELDTLKNADAVVENLKEDIEFTYSKLKKLSDELSAERLKSADILKSLIEKELYELGMQGAAFDIVFTRTDAIREDGYDNIEFMISPNIGAPLMPLAKIASGGECSRIMLAIKVIVAALDELDTIIFDEIDSGISGNTATIVACKLSKVSRDRQVIAVTHLPQLASMADNHLKIEKFSDNNTTLTKVSALDYTTSAEEVARLIGGKDYSGYALPHAEKMIGWSQEFKKTI